MALVFAISMKPLQICNSLLARIQTSTHQVVLCKNIGNRNIMIIKKS